jgi:hypothetical protein
MKRHPVHAKSISKCCPPDDIFADNEVGALLKSFLTPNAVATENAGADSSAHERRTKSSQPGEKQRLGYGVRSTADRRIVLGILGVATFFLLIIMALQHYIPSVAAN